MKPYQTILRLTSSIGEVAWQALKDSVTEAVLSLDSEPKKIYNAKFGDASEVLSASHSGFNISGQASLSIKNSYTNLAVIGRTGTGKSTINACCTALNSDNCSFVIHDPAKQFVTLLGTDFEKRGFKVYVFDPDSERSHCINPLDGVQNQTDIHKICEHLVRTGLGESREKFWELSSIQLLSVMLGLLLREPKRYHNLINLKYLLDTFAGNPKAVHRLAAKAPQDLYSAYRALVAGAEKTLKSTVMTTSVCLDRWTQSTIGKITSRTDIDFTKFRHEPSVLFIVNDSFNAVYNRPIVALLLDQLFKLAMNEVPEPNSVLPLWFLIDEAGQLPLASLPQAVSVNRKYAVGFMLLFQNISQCYNNFGKENATTILANCAHLYYGGMDMNTARSLSELLGKRMVTAPDGREIVANLMHSQDLRMLKPDQALFIFGANRPYLVNVRPYYKSPYLRKRTEVPVWTYPNGAAKPVNLLPFHAEK